MTASMTLEDFASIAVLCANAVFIVVSVASYLRMNAHEQRRQQFIVRALNDTRDSGRELKGVARDLARLMERAERMRLWQRSGSGESLGHSTSDWDAEPSADIGPEPDMQRLRPLDSPASMQPEAYAEWRRLHQVELDRVLQQRRRLQDQLATALQRQQEAERQLHNTRARASINAEPRSEPNGRERQLLQHAQAQLQEALQRSEDGESQLQKLRKQLQTLEGRLERSLIEKDFIEDHLLRLDRQERQQQTQSLVAST
jgi:vacuolar-type H+-ATPase subunit I/STV1